MKNGNISSLFNSGKMLFKMGKVMLKQVVRTLVLATSIHSPIIGKKIRINENTLNERELNYSPKP